MLYITIPETELFDDDKLEFIKVPKCTLALEHSLVSISKWESRWHKAFLTKDPRTREELVDYIRCMTITQNVKPEVYWGLTEDNIKTIMDYIDNPMTATTVRNEHRSTSRRVVTSEVVYAWMIGLQIPLECQKWHFNRLMMLIQVVNAQNEPPKKMSRNELASRNRQLNEARRQKYRTTG